MAARRSQQPNLRYDDKSVRLFMIASIFWGIVGMLVGVIIATQLSWWQMNGKFLEALTFGAIKAEGISFLTFGRLRPLHTNAVIFAFVGNMMFAGIYYSTQRLCKARTASTCSPKSTSGAGSSSSWPPPSPCRRAHPRQGIRRAHLADQHRRRRSSGWSSPSTSSGPWRNATNPASTSPSGSTSPPSSPWRCSTSSTTSRCPPRSSTAYPIFGGVQDGLVQWWYGHNAVAFFLTTPILGIMYYFLPKAADRPVYSYRLSIIHFWSLVFIYIWAGPHHLLNTALPHWLQMLGMLFSLMLWAPSWGGMLNGLLTLRGAWDKLRTDPVIKFFAAGVTFYGMATFEGPLLSIRAVNALSHYTDWTIGHVHSGALGWNGFMAAGMFYWLAPRLWKTKLWSTAPGQHALLDRPHGILLYVAAMWCAGIMQGLMLNQPGQPGGTTLKYEFIETLESIQIFYILRSIGGTLYLAGFILCASTSGKPPAPGRPRRVRRDRPAEKKQKDGMTWGESVFNDPLAHIFLAMAFVILWFFLPPHADKAALLVALLLSYKAYTAFKASKEKWTNWHERLIENYLPFTVLSSSPSPSAARSRSSPRSSSTARRTSRAACRNSTPRSNSPDATSMSRKVATTATRR
jgi:cytochrome c oxidase cbb3-type subunit I/II